MRDLEIIERLHLHEEGAGNPSVNSDGGDTVDERCNRVPAATRNTADVDAGALAREVSINTNSTDIEVEGGRSDVSLVNLPRQPGTTSM